MKLDRLNFLIHLKRRRVFYVITGLCGGLVWIGLFLVFYLHQRKKGGSEL
jgi:uncharacterized membrane protein YuzA (DUF378 family)